MGDGILNGTSVAEQFIYLCFREVFEETLNRYKLEYMDKKIELDIYIPSIGLAIECNGVLYHRKFDNKQDLELLKTEICKQNEIRLIHIYDSHTSTVPYFKDDIICYKVDSSNKLKQLMNIVYILFSELRIEAGKKLDAVALYRTAVHNTKNVKIENSLFGFDEQLAMEYDSSRLNVISSKEIAYGSRENVYWKCRECGHIWNVMLCSRTTNRQGCPNCYNKNRGKIRRMAVREEDYVKVKRADLADEYIEDSSGIGFDSLVCWGNTIVTWKCRVCGHIWQTAIKQRAVLNKGCLQCYNNNRSEFKRKEAARKNPLSECSKSIVREFNEERNGFSASDISKGSHTKVWWKCSKCGHEWMTTPNERTTHKTGCPNYRKHDK